jgi:hypothetical protein
MVEAIINHWTFYHFLFGLGTFLIVNYLLRHRNPQISISLFILVLWEVFEFRNHSYYWVVNYQNNIMDVIVGFVAVFLGIIIIDYLRTH